MTTWRISNINYIRIENYRSKKVNVFGYLDVNINNSNDTRNEINARIARGITEQKLSKLLKWYLLPHNSMTLMFHWRPILENLTQAKPDHWPIKMSESYLLLILLLVLLMAFEWTVLRNWYGLFLFLFIFLKCLFYHSHD